MASDQPSCERILINAALREALDGGTAAGLAAQPSTSDKPAADAFPGHRLVEEIHRGGQGIVYRARQERTGRDVAIKLMREGPYSGPVSKSRFEREVQILARLKHPNIVTIHESAVVDGNHYFVMDYIAGTPLDQFVAQRDWPAHEVLRLFAKVCRAVNAAHVRGIIHRDLKPSNILIDEAGEPHILDFGLAKFESDHENGGASASHRTQTGQFVGSLPWASPEQADGTADKVDLRTDTYSLGVLLYQALTGKFPYRVVGSMREVLGNILEANPKRMRSIESGLDPDIETITLKCLEKDPDRRYQTAGSLSDDIDRFLSNQPIQARPATTLYQLKKLVIRNRLPFGLMTALFLAVLGFSIWMAVLYQRSDALRVKAEYSAGKAEQVASFLVDLFDISDPSRAQGSVVTARQILANGAVRIRKDLADQPDVRASMMHVMGMVYRKLGLVDEALPLLEGALRIRKALYAPNDLRVAESLDELSVLHRARGAYESAEELGRQALAIRRAVLGPEHQVSLASLNNIALTQAARGRLDEVENLVTEYARLAKGAFENEHEAYVTSYKTLARLLEELGRYAEAESLFRKALDRAVAHLEQTHPLRMETMADLGHLLHKRTQLVEAEALLRQALEQQRRVLGDEHPSTQATVNYLGLLLNDKRELKEATALFRESADVRTRVLGPVHPETLSSVHNLALLQMELRQPADAEKGLRRAWESYKQTLGKRHPLTIGALGNLASAIKSQSRLDEAESYYRMAVDGMKEVLGDEHPDTLVMMGNYASTLKAQGRLDEAEALLRRVLEAQRRVLGDDQAQTLTTMNNLASTLKALGKLSESEELYRETLQARIRQLGGHDTNTRISMNNLAKILMEQEKYDEAEPWLARAMTEDAGQSPHEALLAIFQGNHGVCLTRLGRFAEAEQELSAAYEATVQIRGPQHPRTITVVKGLVELYEAWGKLDRAVEYRALLAEPSKAQPQE